MVIPWKESLSTGERTVESVGSVVMLIIEYAIIDGGPQDFLDERAWRPRADQDGHPHAGVLKMLSDFDVALLMNQAREGTCPVCGHRGYYRTAADLQRGMVACSDACAEQFWRTCQAPCKS